MLSLQSLLILVQTATRNQNASCTKQIHAYVTKIGFQSFPLLSNGLVNSYGKCSFPSDAFQLFNEIPQRDLFTWSSLLASLTNSNLAQKALTLFSSSFSLGKFQPDNFIFATLLNACASLLAAKQGKQVHAQFLTSPFSDDDVVKSALVDVYSKCHFPDDARKVFDTIRNKNTVSWTAMVNGYSRNGRYLEALEIFQNMPAKNLFSWTAFISGLVQNGDAGNAFKLFKEMRREVIHIEDPFVISSIIGASASMARLEVGRQLHCLVMVFGYDSSIYVGNALVDMYAKCSDIFASKKVFDGINRKDVVSWTAMIVGAAQHGWAEEAVELFNEMVLGGLTPNEVTFVGVIYACSQKGLVNKGRQLFKSMMQDYGIKPSLQHYTCLLDLLSRSGLLREAKNLLLSMPFKPDEATWAALLSACKQQEDIPMAIQVANHLFSLNPGEPSTYILLSNTFAHAGMWDHVAKVRKMISVLAGSKTPGYSWVEQGVESYMFCAGKLVHPMRDEIVCMLKRLMNEMKDRSSFLLQDLEQ